MSKNILIMAGGTGGHVFPALACARMFADQGYQVHWLGTRRGIEAELIPAAGIAIHYIDVQGLRGKGKLGLLKAPLQLLRALGQCLRLLAGRSGRVDQAYSAGDPRTERSGRNGQSSARAPGCTPL